MVKVRPWHKICSAIIKPLPMSKEKKPDKPAEIPQPDQNPEIRPATHPDKTTPTLPEKDPEISPETEPGQPLPPERPSPPGQPSPERPSPPDQPSPGAILRE